MLWEAYLPLVVTGNMLSAFINCGHHPTARCRLLHDDQKESGLLPVLSRLLKGFSFKHQPRSHAKEIVEAIHITLRLLERLSKQGARPPALHPQAVNIPVWGARASPHRLATHRSSVIVRSAHGRAIAEGCSWLQSSVRSW